MTFPLKEWHDAPNESTPVDTVSLNDAEQRLGAYTDAHELHWRAPVANFGALPEGEEEGDVRITLDTGNIYRWHEGSKTWKLLHAEAGHWKAPVAKVANLPAEGNENGDVRLVLEGAVLYWWKEAGEEWILLDIEATEFWRPPVEKFSELAAKKATDPEGTVRLVIEQGIAYWLVEEKWEVLNQDNDLPASSHIATSEEPTEGEVYKLLPTPDEVKVDVPEGGGFLAITPAVTMTTGSSKEGAIEVQVNGKSICGGFSNEGKWFETRENGNEERYISALAENGFNRVSLEEPAEVGQQMGIAQTFWVPAGSYTVTLKFRQTSTGVKVKDRSLVVEVL